MSSVRRWARFITPCTVALMLGGCLAKHHTPWAGLAGSPSGSAEPAARAARAALAVGPAAGRPPPEVTLQPAGTTPHYEVSRLAFRSAGVNGQSDNLVAGRYYRAHGPGRKGLVIVLPIWGASRYPPNATARRLRKDDPQAVNVVVLDGERSLFDWQAIAAAASGEALVAEAERSVRRVEATVEDVRRLLDWATRRPEIDPDRIGIVGFSFSAIVAALVMGGDPRIDAGVFVMGGANLHEAFAACGSIAGRTRERVIRRLGWTAERFGQVLEAPLAPVNPKFVAVGVDPSRVLVIESSRDGCLPESSRRDFWHALGRPERIVVHGGHRWAFLALTFLDGHWATRRVSRFLHERLAPAAGPAAVMADQRRPQEGDRRARPGAGAGKSGGG